MPLAFVALIYGLQESSAERQDIPVQVAEQHFRVWAKSATLEENEAF